MGFFTRDYNYSDRDSSNYQSQRREIDALNTEVQKLRNDSNRMYNASIRGDEATRKMHQEIYEMHKKEEERNAETNRLLQKNFEELAFIKAEQRRVKKEESENNKKNFELLKKKKEKLEQEKKELDRQKKQEEAKKQELYTDNKLKESINRYKKDLKKYLDSGNEAAISDFIKKSDEEIKIYNAAIMQYEGIDSSIIRNFYTSVCFGYEEIADFFYATKEFNRAAEMYNKLENFAEPSSIKPILFYKFGKAAMAVSQYFLAISYFKKFLKSGEAKASKNRTLLNEINLNCFEASLKIEDDIQAEYYLAELIRELNPENTIAYKFLDIYYDYLCYKPSEKKFITYMSYFVAILRNNRDFRAKLSNQLFKEYKWRNFYLAICDYREKNFVNAIKLLNYYDENKLARIYKLRIIAETEKYEEVKQEEVKALAKLLEGMLAGKERDKRVDFLNQNEMLLIWRQEVSTDFAIYYQYLLTLLLNIELKSSMIEQLLEDSSTFLEKLQHFNIPPIYQTKMLLAKLYNFFKTQNNLEKANTFYSYLEKNTSKEEFELLISQNFNIDNHIEDIYDISDQRLPYIDTPLYYSVKCCNKTDYQSYCILETYRENISKENRDKRLQALQREQNLGLKYNSFTPVYAYEVLEDISRVVYPEYEDNLSNYLDKSFSYDDDNKNEIVSFAKDLVQIFENLELEKIILSSLAPEKIMISKDGKLMLRDTFFDQSFKSESQSTINSARTSKSNKYKSPDERKGRTVKSNLYLLGILLYELFYGKYIFEGVNEFSIITLLHKDSQVNKDLVYSLKNRWIKSVQDAVTVRVEKVRIDDASPIPRALQEMIMRLLDSNPEKRPPIQDVNDKLLSLNMEEKSPTTRRKEKKSYDKNITKTQLEEIISKSDISKVVVKKSCFQSTFFSEITNCEVDKSLENYDFVIINSDSIIEVKTFMKRYKVSVKSINNPNENKVKISSIETGSQKNRIDFAKLINLLTEKMNNCKNEEYEDFLFHTRVVVSLLEENKDIRELIDDEYLALARKNSVEISRSIRQENYLKLINELMIKE